MISGIEPSLLGCKCWLVLKTIDTQSGIASFQITLLDAHLQMFGAAVPLLLIGDMSLREKKGGKKVFIDSCSLFIGSFC